MNSVHKAAPNIRRRLSRAPSGAPHLRLPTSVSLALALPARIRHHIRTATAKLKDKLQAMNVVSRRKLERNDAKGDRSGPAAPVDVIDLVSENEDLDSGNEWEDLENDGEEDDDDDHLFQPYMGDQHPGEVRAMNASLIFNALPNEQHPANLNHLMAGDHNHNPNAYGASHIWEDYDFDDPFGHDDLARLMMDDMERPLEIARNDGLPHSVEPLVNLGGGSLPVSDPQTREDCVDAILVIFPDICRDHVSRLYDKVSPSSDRLVAHILDKMESGSPYPKAKDLKKVLKRKREVDEDEAAVLKYGAADRAPAGFGPIRPYMRVILSQEFSTTPMAFIDATMSQSQYRLFHAYRVLEEANRTFDPANQPYNKIKKPRPMHPQYQPENLQASINNVAADPALVEVLRELQAARKVKDKANEKREAEQQAELDEQANVQKAQEEGTMSECGCCFGDFPLNRMVHCDGDILHWFCRGCARQSAETEIGNSKYELNCMSMDGCKSGFAMDQRSQFLDEKTVIALERNEQEAMLRMAGIENLASCPFCPFAAEYPPVEVNKEFRCQAPDCEKVSCRLCKLDSHIPKSCEENAKENGLSVRRQIEEAMSAALIRKCNKCGTPFVKEEGCNKMTCTRNGCFNVQCYVCSKSCGYNHFNDRSRGGKAGNCPLFESVEDRHDQEVKKAEKEALDKVRAEHPEFSDEDLQIKVSEAVLKDDKRRKAVRPRMHPFQGDDLRMPDFHEEIARINAYQLLRPQYLGGPPPPADLPEAADDLRWGAELDGLLGGDPFENLGLDFNEDIIEAHHRRIFAPRRDAQLPAEQLRGDALAAFPAFDEMIRIPEHPALKHRMANPAFDELIRLPEHPLLKHPKAIPQQPVKPDNYNMQLSPRERLINLQKGNMEMRAGAFWELRPLEQSPLYDQNQHPGPPMQQYEAPRRPLEPPFQPVNSPVGREKAKLRMQEHMRIAEKEDNRVGNVNANDPRILDRRGHLAAEVQRRANESLLRLHLAERDMHLGLQRPGHDVVANAVLGANELDHRIQAKGEPPAL